MHIPLLILDLATILMVAAVVTFLFRRIKQPLVLGYIIAGVIVGPYTPAIFSVHDTNNIKVWAELGVIFLMFSLGLEFSFRRLAKVGGSAAITGVIQIVGMVVCGVIVAQIFSWSRLDGVFLGCMIAISSTTIIVKALEELNLMGKKFSELVFGILIVEDLAAILMMVALTNVATSSDINGLELLFAALKLIAIVAVWYVVGIFFVPRFVKSVSKYGNDEMLTIVAIGMCLALVALAAKLHYSVALGAFIMGSILAETAEVKRIEHLTQPLKDIFGAIFFVSVGMMLDPENILTNWLPILVISLVIIIGKIIFVAIGSLTTGQSIATSVQTSLSMAQIGEFSFIIGSLGMVYGVINAKIYPIIVAASIITTFTTPYLIKLSPFAVKFISEKSDSKIILYFERYATWIKRQATVNTNQQQFIHFLSKWLINAILISIIFTFAFKYLIPVTEKWQSIKIYNNYIVWIIAFSLSTPSIWAMTTIFRSTDSSVSRQINLIQDLIWIISILATIGLISILSSEYFSGIMVVFVFFIISIIAFILFHKKLEEIYSWLEYQFRFGFNNSGSKSDSSDQYKHLVPWDAHLIEVSITAYDKIIGESLINLKLRERFGVNVVVIRRGDLDIIAPSYTEVIFPGDKILCFATDEEIENFKKYLIQNQLKKSEKNPDQFQLKSKLITANSELVGQTIQQSNLRHKFNCIIVGIERNGIRISNPTSQTKFLENDLVWIVFEDEKKQQLNAVFGT